MKKRRNRTRNILLIVVFAIAIISIPTVLMLPIGSRVHAVVSVTDNSISVESCYLKKLYSMSMIDPENTVSAGTNSVNMTVLNANTQTEIFSITRIQLGVGNCVVDSPRLPNLDVNTSLVIRFQLLNSKGDIISQNETSLVYK